MEAGGRAPAPLGSGWRPPGLFPPAERRGAAAGHRKARLGGRYGAPGRLRGTGSPRLAGGARPPFVRERVVAAAEARPVASGAAAAVSRPPATLRGVVGGLGKGRGELGRRDRCHHCRRLRPGGTPSLRRRRHLVTPAPANTKCPQSRGAASSRRRARWERELGRSLGRVGCEPEGGTGSARGAAHTRPSVTPSPPRGACALPCLRTAQACCGLASLPRPARPPPPKAGAHFHFRPSAGPRFLLPAKSVQAPRLMPGCALGSHPPPFFYIQMWPVEASGLLGSGALTSIPRLRRFLTFDPSSSPSPGPSFSQPSFCLEREKAELGELGSRSGSGFSRAYSITSN